MFATLAAGLLVTACGNGDAAQQAQSAPSATSQSAVGPDEYADWVVDAFRATHPDGGAHSEVSSPDWAAFVSTIEGLTPPEGEELDHERMVAGFEAYVEAREEADDVCAASPGPGGPCFTAVSAASDQWSAALERAYELPGLSWQSLLG